MPVYPSIKVLFVDDEKYWRQGYAAELQATFDVQFEADALKARDAMRFDKQLAAVVMDIRMPTPPGIDASQTRDGKETGFWVVAQVAPVVRDRLPVLFLTNQDHHGVPARLLDLPIPAMRMELHQKLDLKARDLPAQLIALMKRNGIVLPPEKPTTGQAAPGARPPSSRG